MKLTAGYKLYKYIKDSTSVIGNKQTGTELVVASFSAMQDSLGYEERFQRGGINYPGVEIFLVFDKSIFSSFKKGYFIESPLYTGKYHIIDIANPGQLNHHLEIICDFNELKNA